MLKKIIFLLLAFVASLSGATHYATSGGAGAKNGSDFSNAFDWGTSQTLTLVRGDTYVVAGGTYQTLIFATVATSGSTYITIRGARSDLDGGVAGWSSAYDTGTTPAKFTTSSGAAPTIEPRSQYLKFSGTLANSATIPNKTQRGLIFESTATSGSNAYVVYVQNGYNVTGLTFENVQFNGVNNAQFSGGDLYINDASTTGLIVDRCYFNGASQFWIKTRDLVGQTITKNYFLNCGSGNASYHSAGVITDATKALNATVSFCFFENMKPLTGSSSYIEPQNNGHTGTPGGLDIYGNVFWASDASENYSPGLVALTGGDSFANLTFYNNTIYGVHGSESGVFGTVNSTNWQVKNNLWQSCSNNPTNPNTTASNNRLNTGSAFTFTNAASGDFRPTANTTTGADLGAPYNVDMDGNTRTTWTLGAFEYVAGTPVPVPVRNRRTQNGNGLGGF